MKYVYWEKINRSFKKIEKSYSNLTKAKQYIAIFILLTICTLIITHNFVAHISNPPRQCEGDYTENLWNLWWVKYSITKLHQNPYYTDYLFYPNGANLIYHTLSLYNTLLLGLPLQYFFDRITTFNILLLQTWILSCFGFFLLVDYLLKDKRIAFLLALAYTFTFQIFRFKIHEINAASVQWLPFFLYFLLRLYDNHSKFNLSMLTITLFLNTLACWYNMIISFVFLGVFILTKIIQKTLTKKFLIDVIISLIIFSIIMLPFIFPIFKLNMGEYPGVTGLKDDGETIDLIYGFKLERGYESLIEFMGVPLFFLVLLSFFKNQKNLVFWKLSLIGFFVLSLGSTLNVLGKETNIFMPFVIFKLIPIINRIETCQKFLFIAFKIPAFILAGFSIKWLISKVIKKKFVNVIIITCIILLLIHLGVQGHKMFRNKYECVYPKIYNEIQKGSSKYTLINIMYMPEQPRRYLPMLMQTIHNKKMFSGRISRSPKYRFDKLLEINSLIDEVNSKEKMRKIEEFALKYNIKYWVIHKQGPHKRDKNVLTPADLLKSRNKTLVKLFNESVYEDENIIVFVNNNFLRE